MLSLQSLYKSSVNDWLCYQKRLISTTNAAGLRSARPKLRTTENNKAAMGDAAAWDLFQEDDSGQDGDGEGWDGDMAAMAGGMAMPYGYGGVYQGGYGEGTTNMNMAMTMAGIINTCLGQCLAGRICFCCTFVFAGYEQMDDGGYGGPMFGGPEMGAAGPWSYDTEAVEDVNGFQAMEQARGGDGGRGGAFRARVGAYYN